VRHFHIRIAFNPAGSAGGYGRGAIRRTPSVMSTRSISRRCQTKILLSFSTEADRVSPSEATPSLF
jgi:hypothetical protein